MVLVLIRLGSHSVLLKVLSSLCVLDGSRSDQVSGSESTEQLSPGSGGGAPPHTQESMRNMETADMTSTRVKAQRAQQQQQQHTCRHQKGVKNVSDPEGLF